MDVIEVENMRWLVILAGMLVIGCSSLNPFPKSSVLRTMKDADRIVANGHEITDPETIAWLREIYLAAKWKPFLDSDPVDQISIKLFEGTEQVLEFTYGVGWLMDESRKGVLNQEQRKWMLDNIRSKIPEENLPDKYII